MKTAASLTASLLARKGQAGPTDGLQSVGIDGQAATSPPRQGQAEIERRLAPKRPVGSGKRIAMTVRLDHEQHLRLRIFSVHQKRSSQEILALALDKYIDENAPAALDTACQTLKS